MNRIGTISSRHKEQLQKLLDEKCGENKVKLVTTLDEKLVAVTTDFTEENQIIEIISFCKGFYCGTNYLTHKIQGLL